MTKIISKIQIQNENNYIASSAYGVCDTASEIANKQAIIQSNNNINFTLSIGITVHIKFIHTNTAINPTLSINGSTAIPIKKYNNISPGIETITGWPDNSILSLTYDGNAYYINSFFDGSSGSGGGGNISPGSSIQNVTTTANSSGGNQNTYARSDHIHKLIVGSGANNGQIQIGNTNVSVTGLAAAAYSDIATSIITGDSRNDNVTTPAAVANFVENKGYLTSVPYSTDLTIDSSSNEKAATPNAVINYIQSQGYSTASLSTNIGQDYQDNTKAVTPAAVYNYINSQESASIQLSTNIIQDYESNTKATTPAAVYNYVENSITPLSTNITNDYQSNIKATTPAAVYNYIESKNYITAADVPSISVPPAFAKVTTNNAETPISATSGANGDLLTINPGTNTYITLDTTNKIVQIGSSLTSLPAETQGTDLTLVTTGDKARWDETSGLTGDGGTSVRRADSTRNVNYYAMVIISDGANGREGQNYYDSSWENGNLNFGGPISTDPVPELYPEQQQSQQGGN